MNSYWWIVGHCFMFFNNVLKKSSISDTEYDPSGNSNLSFHVGADILNLFLYEFFYFSMNSRS